MQRCNDGDIRNYSTMLAMLIQLQYCDARKCRNACCYCDSRKYRNACIYCDTLNCRNTHKLHCYKWLMFHFCELENSRLFAEFLVLIDWIIFSGL